MRKRGFTIRELLAAILILVVGTLLLLPALSRENPNRPRAFCQNNLKQMGTVFRMYANESKTLLPPVKPLGFNTATGLCDAPNTGEFFFYGPAVFPEYLSDAEVLVCPSDDDGIEFYRRGGFNVGNGPGNEVDPCRLAAESYNYLGWAFWRRDAWLAEGADANALFTGDAKSYLSSTFDPGFLEAFERVFSGSDPADFDRDLSFTHATKGPVVVPRFRKGIGRLLITDLSDYAVSYEYLVPVMFDRARTRAHDHHHVPSGMNVLFLDGHVEFRKYPGEHPATISFAVLNESLPAL